MSESTFLWLSFFCLDVFIQPLDPCFGGFGVFLSCVLGQLHVSLVLSLFLFTFDARLNVPRTVYVTNF